MQRNQRRISYSDSSGSLDRKRGCEEYTVEQFLQGKGWGLAVPALTTTLRRQIVTLIVSLSGGKRT